MQELVIGTIEYQGSADPALTGRRRNAVCKTTDGRTFHIRDYSWHWVGAEGCNVPRFKSRESSFIQRFPHEGDQVYALVDFSIKGKRGPNPDALAWATADRYERGIKRVLGYHYVMGFGKQDALLAEVRDMVDSGTFRYPVGYDMELMTLEKLIVGKPAVPSLEYMTAMERFTHKVMINFFRHYVLGVSAEAINQRAAA